MVVSVLSEAQRLHSIGLNPIPLKYASKRPFVGWQRHEAARIYAPLMDRIFDSHIAVGLGVLTGRSSRNLFVVDADTPEAFARIHSELDRRGIQTWTRSSARGGQFWFLCLEGIVANKPMSDGWETIGNNRMVVAPPSIHPGTGEILDWIEMPDASGPLEVCLDDLDFLALSLHRKNRLSAEKSILPQIADLVLIQQDVSKWGGDNSRAEYAAVWSLCGAGASDKEIEAIFARCRPYHYRKIGEKEWQRACLGPARRNFEARNNDDGQNSVVAKQALTIRRAIESMQWPGCTGASDRAVLVALTERMRLDNNLHFRASRREIAILAGLATVTVGKALTRLQAGPDPWICAVDNDSRTGACRWAISLAKIRNVGTGFIDEGIAMVTSGTANVPQGHDVWHRSALGKSAQLVLDHLNSKGSATPEQLVASTGKVISTIRKALAKLSQQGIVYEETGQWYVSQDLNDSDLGRVAVVCRTWGKRRAKETMFREERERHGTLLTMQTIERSVPASGVPHDERNS